MARRRIQPVPWHRGKVLAFMASFASVVGERALAEGYLLELVSWAAFADYKPS